MKLIKLIIYTILLAIANNIAYAKDIIDQNKKLQWLLSEAEKGNARFQNQLGSFYKRGEWVEKSDEKAFYWYSESAKNGWHIGQANLALMYEQGRGVKKNLVEAFNWYIKSSDNGNDVAPYKVAMLFIKGCQKANEDMFCEREATLHYLNLSIERGYLPAKVFLGIMYDEGLGIHKNKEKAQNLFLEACNSGNQDGCKEYKRSQSLN